MLRPSLVMMLTISEIKITVSGNDVSYFWQCEHLKACHIACGTTLTPTYGRHTPLRLRPWLKIRELSKAATPPKNRLRLKLEPWEPTKSLSKLPSLGGIARVCHRPSPPPTVD